MKLSLKEVFLKEQEEVEQPPMPETAQEALDNFDHDDAAQYGKVLLKNFGEPDEFSRSYMVWYDIMSFKLVCLKDESVPHNFPEAHRDFVYGVIDIDVPPEWHSVFAEVTGSIIIDGLKGEVWARCGSLGANAVTLKYVEDAVAGEVTQDPDVAKEEYGRRIREMETPDWYEEFE